MSKGAWILLLIFIIFIVVSWYFGYLDIDAIIDDIQGLFGK